MMRAIIFGAAGQDGHYLTQLLKKKQCEVMAVSRSAGYVQTDITNFEEVHQLIKKEQPDFIFNFAANSTTKHEALFENHATICSGTLNILEAVKMSSPFTKVFLSGSGLQFRNVGKPIKETDDFEARDPYSVNRIHSVYAARYYRMLGIKTYVGYFFNHDSPLRTERHMSKKIAEAVKRIDAGSDEKLAIGDISVVKEWTFAGDIVEAVWTLVNQNQIFEAVIGSGKGYSIEDWLQCCFSIIGKDWKQYVMDNKEYTPQYDTLVADPGLINSLQWKPAVSLQQLAQMMIKS